MKKRILSLLLVLTMLLPLVPAIEVTAEGVTTYALKIAGVDVTSANAADILGNGAFSYNAGANRLTVSGNLTYTGIVISNSIKNLEIYVASDSRLENVDPDYNFTAYAVVLRADTTITGPGRLILPHTKDTQPLWVDDDVLTIRDAYVEGGIGSFSNGEAQLNIINSTVRTGEKGGIRTFPGGFTLTNCYISAPDGAYAADDGVRINSSPATDVVILPGNDPDIHSYDLIVGGVLVTDANKKDILGNGVFRFDPEYNDLKIYGDYSYDKDGMIINEIPSLNIRAQKDCTLTCPGVIIEAVADTDLFGPGMLRMQSAVSSCVHANEGVRIGLYSARINVEGSKYGFTGTNGPSNEKLDIDRSFLDGFTKNGSVSGFRGGVTVTGCKIISPDPYHIENGAITATKGKPAGWVTIAIEYDLWIAGFRVNNGNAPDVLGDGVFEYEDDLKKLTIKGDFDYTYDGSDDYPLIRDELPDLTIYVEKESHLTACNSSIIKVDKAYVGSPKTLTIKGPGKLWMSSYANCIFLNYNVTLTLDHADLDVDSEANVGIREVYDSYGKLIVNESSLHAVGDVGAVAYIKEAQLIDCEVTYPYYVKFKNGAFMDDDEVVKDFTIKPKVRYGFSVAGVEVTSLNNQNILGDYSASFDPGMNWLNLHKNITYSGDVIVNESREGLIIYAENVTLKASGESAVIKSYEDLTIKGSGKLTLDGGRSGILMDGGATLTLDGADLTIKNTSYGILGVKEESGAVDEHLVVKHSAVNVTSSKGGAFNFKTITLTGCQIQQPTGGYVENNAVMGSSIVDSHGDKANTLVIKGVWNIWIAGVQLTSDTLNAFGSNISYDPEGNALILEGTPDSSHGGGKIGAGLNMIRVAEPGLTIYVTDYTRLTGGDAGLVVEADTTITGSGTLELHPAGTTVGATVRNGATLTLDKASLTISANNATCGLDGVNSETLVLKDSTLYVTAKTYGVLNFKNIVLDRTELVTPSGGYVGAYGSVYTSSGAYADNVRFDPHCYGIWIQGRPVNARNAEDVLGDGTVRYYEPGEYSATDLDLEYGVEQRDFDHAPVLVLNNFQQKDEGWHEDGNRSAQLYFDVDPTLYVVLKGENTFRYACGDDEDEVHPHGIFTGVGEEYLWFLGDGSLSVDARYYDRYGLYGEGTTIHFCEEVNVTLRGAHGARLIFNDMTPCIKVEDNAKLTCIATQTDSGYDWAALYCAEVQVFNHGEILAYTTFNGQALETWRDAYSCFYSAYSDIKVLKKGEYAPGSIYSTGTQPYEPPVGINVKGGVSEADYRYVSIKGKTVNATEALFQNDSYTVKPSTNGKSYASLLLKPYAAPDIDRSEVIWESSDPRIVTLTPTESNSGVYFTGWQNGVVTVTATVPGGAKATCTVTATGFENAVKPIETVQINGYTNPYIGQTPDEYLNGLSVPAGAGYYIEDAHWEWDNLPDGRFAEGNNGYYLCLTLIPKEGYTFNPFAMPEILPQALSDGLDTAATELYAFGLYLETHWLHAELPPYETISEVNLTGFTVPQTGQTVINNLSSAKVPAGAHYAIAGLVWETYDYEEDDIVYLDNYDTFVTGKNYWLKISLSANDGYRFAGWQEDSLDTTTTLLNSSGEFVDGMWARETYEKGTQLVYYTMDFKAGVERLTEARLTGFTEPQVGQSAGENLATLTVPAGAHYTIAEATWYQGDGDSLATLLHNYDLFEADKPYYLFVRLAPTDGYWFDYDHYPDAWINGSTSCVYSTHIFEDEIDLLLWTVNFFPGLKRIDQVKVTGFAVPQVGQTVAANLASLSVDPTSHCAIDEAFWRPVNGVGTYSDSDVFAEGMEVELVITFTPAEGYYFADSCGATINGSQTYLADCDFEEDEFFIITRDFTVGGAQTGDILWGDANEDNKISNLDVVRLKNYLANYDEDTGISSNGTTTYTLGPGADANFDGKISNLDVVRLKNYLANYDEDTGISSNGTTTYILGPDPGPR